MPLLHSGRFRYSLRAVQYTVCSIQYAGHGISARQQDRMHLENQCQINGLVTASVCTVQVTVHYCTFSQSSKERPTDRRSRNMPSFLFNTWLFNLPIVICKKVLTKAIRFTRVLQILKPNDDSEA